MGHAYLQRLYYITLLTALLSSTTALVAGQDSAGTPKESEYFFFNSVSGKSQWEDPGDVPYVDENGNRFWMNEHGEFVNQDANAWRYVWVERWSEEHKRPYFYNQETKHSTWARPADLAWQRVLASSADAAMVPKGSGSSDVAAGAPGAQEAVPAAARGMAPETASQGAGRAAAEA